MPNLSHTTMVVWYNCRTFHTRQWLSGTIAEPFTHDNGCLAQLPNLSHTTMVVLHNCRTFHTRQWLSGTIAEPFTHDNGCLAQLPNLSHTTMVVWHNCRTFHTRQWLSGTIAEPFTHDNGCLAQLPNLSHMAMVAWHNCLVFHTRQPFLHCKDYHSDSVSEILTLHRIVLQWLSGTIAEPFAHDNGCLAQLPNLSHTTMVAWHNFLVFHTRQPFLHCKDYHSDSVSEILTLHRILRMFDTIANVSHEVRVNKPKCIYASLIIMCRNSNMLTLSYNLVSSASFLP